ncbi:MAG: O-antigen ligase family protein [Symploca sp. SIO2D2]|nr:O-antigen ligase family protein [Symploca sp. SIO2D2]
MSWETYSYNLKSPTVSQDNSLFRGIFLRWSNLTLSEKVVCANIVLIPLWWIGGLYKYMAALIVFGIMGWEWKKHRAIPLKKPTFSVISLITFATYVSIGQLFFSLYNPGKITTTEFIRSLLFWFPIAFLLWYIQSKEIKVRPEVVAWSFSVNILQMMGFWIVGQLILGAGIYDPPRTIFSLLSGNASGSYDAGKGLANYLIPYRPEDVSIASFARWSFFFIIPEIAALVFSFFVLLSLDLKNRLWSITLASSSFFLLLITGTRSALMALPLTMALRYTFSIGKNRGFYIPLALAALLVFTTLSLPIVTNSITTSIEKKQKDVGEFRADSTKVRGDIYKGTLESIPDKLFFGHWVPGPTVLPGFDLGRIGTHSFILGRLLYHIGLVGTTLFASFWLSLFVWLYKTGKNRPLCGYGLLILYTLVSPVMEFGESLCWLIVLLGTTICYPTKYLSQTTNNNKYLDHHLNRKYKLRLNDDYNR